MAQVPLSGPLAVYQMGMDCKRVARDQGHLGASLREFAPAPTNPRLSAEAASTNPPLAVHSPLVQVPNYPRPSAQEVPKNSRWLAVGPATGPASSSPSQFDASLRELAPAPTNPQLSAQPASTNPPLAVQSPLAQVPSHSPLSSQALSGGTRLTAQVAEVAEVAEAPLSRPAAVE